MLVNNDVSTVPSFESQGVVIAYFDVNYLFTKSLLKLFNLRSTYQKESSDNRNYRYH